MSVAFSVLVAHQGGWDEILLVAGPMAVIVFLIRLARKRADTIADSTTAPDVPNEANKPNATKK